MAGDLDCSSSGLDKGLGGQKQEVMAGDHDCSSLGLDKGLGGQKQEVMAGDLDCSSSGLDKGLGSQTQHVIAGDHDCSISGLDKGLGGQTQEVMAGDHDCSSLGLDKGTSGAGQVTGLLSAARELGNRELQNDATSSSTGEQTYYSTAPRELWAEPLSKDLEGETTSNTGEHTYYSTAPQELWTQTLSKDLQDLNFVAETQNNEVESSCVEVLLLEPSDLISKGELAGGGQGHVHFATCPKLRMPVVIKILKDVNVDVIRLQRRMERVMQTRKTNRSPICPVFGVGKNVDGKVCVVMEKQQGDLLTVINSRMKHLEDGSMGNLDDGRMPFDYNETVAIMLEVAQGLRDLHSCDLIHGDIKASNILVYSVPMVGEGWDQAGVPMYFRSKIADFDTPDDIWGSGFWRAPEVLQEQKSGATRRTPSTASDVYSYGMLCYELLTGRIPFGDCKRSDYNMVISGQRPQLPAHLNLRMKELLHACWRANPLDRPELTWILEFVCNEFMLHPLFSNRQFTPECGYRMINLRIDDEALLDKLPSDSDGVVLHKKKYLTVVYSRYK